MALLILAVGIARAWRCSYLLSPLLMLAPDVFAFLFVLAAICRCGIVVAVVLTPCSVHSGGYGRRLVGERRDWWGSWLTVWIGLEMGSTSAAGRAVEEGGERWEWLRANWHLPLWAHGSRHAYSMADSDEGAE